MAVRARVSTVAVLIVVTTLSAACGAGQTQAKNAAAVLSRTTTEVPTSTTLDLTILVGQFNAAMAPAESDLDRFKQDSVAEQAIVLPSPPPPPNYSDPASVQQYITSTAPSYSQALLAAEGKRAAAEQVVNSDSLALGHDLSAVVPAVLALPWPATFQSDVRAFAAAASQLGLDQTFVAGNASGAAEKVATDVATYNSALAVLESDLTHP